MSYDQKMRKKIEDKIGRTGEMVWNSTLGNKPSVWHIDKDFYYEVIADEWSEDTELYGLSVELKENQEENYKLA